MGLDISVPVLSIALLTNNWLEVRYKFSKMSTHTLLVTLGSVVLGLNVKALSNDPMVAI